MTPSRRSFLATSLAAVVSRGGTAQASPAPSDPAAMSLTSAAEMIRTRKISPVDLTQACLENIKSLNPKTNSWITVFKTAALAQAKEAEKQQASGNLRGALHGIPVGIKDSIDTAGTRTTAASAVYEYRTPAEDAEVVTRLKSAGAVLLGKCNMHEFDAGTSSAVSYWGPVRNPWNLEKIPGGASGGSAAAVATANCFAALGTDSNGGIRIPAAFCGVTGFKPTYGRISMRGIIPYSYSLDHCGPLTRSVEDAILLMPYLAGFDMLDIDSLDKPIPDYAAALKTAVASFSFGLPPQYFDHVDPEIASAVEAAISVLTKLTKGVRDVHMPSLLHAGVPGEIAAFHEGLRGVNQGGFEPSTARVFPTGQDATRAVDFIKGWRELQVVRRAVDLDLFASQKLDFVVAPATRHAAPGIEEVLVPSGGSGGGAGGGRGARGGAAAASPPTPAPAAAESRNLGPLDEITLPFNAYGIPDITLPCGYSKDGMPIGLQLAGPTGSEPALLAVARAYQLATDWHTRRPNLSADTKVPALSKAAQEQTGG